MSRNEVLVMLAAVVFALYTFTPKVYEGFEFPFAQVLSHHLCKTLSSPSELT